MKNKITRTIAVALAFVLVLALASGCSLVSVNEDADLAQVVAVVGGEEILKGEFVELFESTSAMYTSWGITVGDLNKENRETLQDMTLDSLLRTKVADYMCEQEGINELTEEDKANIAAELEYSKANLMAYYIEYAKQAAWEDPSIDVQAYAEQMLLSAAQSAGAASLTLEMYWMQLEDEITADYLYDKAMYHFCGDTTVEEAEIQAWYDEHLATDKQTYTDSPEDYRTNQELTERYEGQDPVLYVPEGYIRVKVICIEPETSIDPSYYEMVEEMATLQGEIGVLTLDDEAGNADRIAEIRARYNELKEESEAMYEAHTNASKQEATAIWRELNAGADFDAVMQEKTEDAYFLTYPIFMEKGRLMTELDCGVTDWDQTIKDAVYKLNKIGDYTNVIVTDTGSYIFQYAGDEKPGVRSLEECRAEIEAIVLEDKIGAAWEAKLGEWVADPELVTTYPEVIRDVGKK